MLSVGMLAPWRSTTQPTSITALEQTVAEKQGQAKPIQGDFGLNPLFGACVWKVQLEGHGQTEEWILVGNGEEADGLLAFPSLWTGPAVSRICSSVLKIAT